MIPPDHSVEAEGPRDICANLAQTFRGLASSGYMRGIDRGPFISYTDWSHWADRLERAVRQIDAEQSPPTSVATCDGCGNDEVCYSFRPTLDESPAYVLCGVCIHNAARATAVTSKLGAVSPTAPPSEQDTPHPSLPAPEDRPQ